MPKQNQSNQQNKGWNVNLPKIKVLAYCDSPTCATGFGTVSRNIFEGLYKTGRYEIDLLGINYWGDPHPFPYRIWPTGTNAERDPYGRKKICAMIPQMKFDLLFFLQDSFIMDFLPELHNFLAKQGRKFRSICYYPVDGTPKEQWIKNVCSCDNVYTYTQFGKAESEKAWVGAITKEIGVVPHGVNVGDYNVLPRDQVAEFRKKYFGAHANKFIFMNLNRNQIRKDIPRTIRAFVEFRKQVPDSLLYLHMMQNDQGWDLPEVCKFYGLSISKDVIFPENFGANQGYPRQVVNMLYNAVDCVISTAVGEGWGLSWIEAMATKTPVIMPANTAITENITEERGFVAKSGIDPNLYTVLPHDNEVPRPLTDVNDMVEKMIFVCNNYDEALRRAENAYKWVTTDLNWQGDVAKRWVEVFDNAYKALMSEENLPKIGQEKPQIQAEEF
jgi:glycosyltransferase involved in cell wall biosynthesis